MPTANLKDYKDQTKLEDSESPGSASMESKEVFLANEASSLEGCTPSELEKFIEPHVISSELLKTFLNNFKILQVFFAHHVMENLSIEIEIFADIKNLNPDSLSSMLISEETRENWLCELNKLRAVYDLFGGHVLKTKPEDEDITKGLALVRNLESAIEVLNAAINCLEEIDLKLRSDLEMTRENVIWDELQETLRDNEKALREGTITHENKQKLQELLNKLEKREQGSMVYIQTSDQEKPKEFVDNESEKLAGIQLRDDLEKTKAKEQEEDEEKAAKLKAEKIAISKESKKEMRMNFFGRLSEEGKREKESSEKLKIGIHNRILFIKHVKQAVNIFIEIIDREGWNLESFKEECRSEQLSYTDEELIFLFDVLNEVKDFPDPDVQTIIENKLSNPFYFKEGKEENDRWDLAQSKRYFSQKFVADYIFSAFEKKWRYEQDNSIQVLSSINLSQQSKYTLSDGETLEGELPSNPEIESNFEETQEDEYEEEIQDQNTSLLAELSQAELQQEKDNQEEDNNKFILDTPEQEKLQKFNETVKTVGSADATSEENESETLQGEEKTLKLKEFAESNEKTVKTVSSTFSAAGNTDTPWYQEGSKGSNSDEEYYKNLEKIEAQFFSLSEIFIYPVSLTRQDLNVTHWTQETRDDLTISKKLASIPITTQEQRSSLSNMTSEQIFSFFNESQSQTSSNTSDNKNSNPSLEVILNAIEAQIRRLTNETKLNFFKLDTQPKVEVLKALKIRLSKPKEEWTKVADVIQEWKKEEHILKADKSKTISVAKIIATQRNILRSTYSTNPKTKTDRFIDDLVKEYGNVPLYQENLSVKYVANHK